MGLRPGEKLFEELVGPGETAEPSPIQRVLKVSTAGEGDDATLARGVAALEALADRGDSDGVLRLLMALVPTFQPWAERRGSEGPGPEAAEAIPGRAREEAAALASDLSPRAAAPTAYRPQSFEKP